METRLLGRTEEGKGTREGHAGEAQNKWREMEICKVNAEVSLD